MTRPLPFLCLAVLAVAAAGRASAAEIAPHRAFYGVSVGAGGSVAGATGAAAASLELTCDGWIMTQRMTADIAGGEGAALRMDTRFAGWESEDHKQYRFAVRNGFGDKEDAFKGRAEAGSGTQPGSVTYTVPREGTLPLPGAVLFPLGHLRRLLDAAAAGQRMVSATVFEGSDDVGTRLATTFIRPAPPADAEAVAALGPLSGTPAWVMRTAYFPAEGSAAVPDFEVEATQFANGVASDIVLDYGDFSVLLTLQRVEPLPAPAC